MSNSTETKTDILTAEQRRERMRRVRQRNTKPELIVRRLLTKLGYRYRLHVRKLPGSPDIVFPSQRKVLFVNGCFWHFHDDPSCRRGRIPKSRTEFWRNKLLQNQERDQRKINQLSILGWDCLTIWECELTDEKILSEKLRKYLD